MITINKIWKEEDEKYAYLKSSINIPNSVIDMWLKSLEHIQPQIVKNRIPLPLDKDGAFVIWYKVQKEYSYGLCTERADAIIVAILYFAMVAGVDIESKIPVTTQLLYQLNHQIIPVYCNEHNRKNTIKIIAENKDEVLKLDKFVGTGVSCGVDSFHAILSNLSTSIKDNRLTHLAVFNTGSFNFFGYENIKSLDSWRQETEKEFKYHEELGRIVATNLGLSFLSVDTNIPDLYQGCFLLSHTLRNNSCILALQKIWSSYYYASTGEGPLFDAKLNKDSGLADLLLLPNISLPNLHFYSVGFAEYRTQKLEIIVDNSVVKKHLNVCSWGHNNCGRCAKCIRTLIALDLMNKLEDYRNTFDDIDYYKKRRIKFLTNVRESSKNDVFFQDLNNYRKCIGLEYSLLENLYHYTYPLRLIRRFIFRVFKR